MKAWIFLPNQVILLRQKKKQGYLKQDKEAFTHRNVVNLVIVPELDTFSRDLNTKFSLGNCLFGAVNLTKNADPNKYEYSGYGIGFNARSKFSLSFSEWNIYVVIPSVDNSLSRHTDNKKGYPSSWWRTNEWIRWYYNNNGD